MTSIQPRQISLRVFYYKTAQIFAKMQTQDDHKQRDALQLLVLKDKTVKSEHLLVAETHKVNIMFRIFFELLRLEKRYHSHRARTERLQRSYFPQAIRILNEDPRLYVLYSCIFLNNNDIF